MSQDPSCGDLVIAIHRLDDRLPMPVFAHPGDAGADLATAVDIGIDKDRVYNTITVTFVGGPGQALVSNILVRVTTSEGLVQQKNFPTNAAGIGTGASVDLTGTKGSDRVEVFVTQGGVMYKLRDENVTHFYY